MSNITLRIVESHEIRRVVEFMKQFEQASKFVTVDIDYATKNYENMVDDGRAVVIVLESGNELFGGLGFIISNDLHNGDLICVETFWFTDPKHRGYGLKLFDAFEECSRNIGAKKTAMIHMMDSYPDNLKKLYERKGYVLIEQHFVKEL